MSKRRVIMTPAENERMREALQALSSNRLDDDAWRVVTDVTFPFALATANRILRGSVDLAKEATWDAYARIARYGDFQLLSFVEPEAFVRYLKQVTRRACYDLIHSLARFSPENQADWSAVEEAIEGDQPTPEQILSAGELHEEILSILGDEERDLLNLVLAGFTITEIAASLSISYDAAGVRLHRLREKIRNQLKNKEL
jgi:RNA polymerase sigma factor (sigma-70 family)